MFGQTPDRPDCGTVSLSSPETSLIHAFEHASAALVILDVNERLLDCSPAFTALMNDDKQELAGREMAALIHSSDRDLWRQSMRKLVEGKTPGFVLEMRLTSRIGSDVWVCNSVSLLCDEDKKPHRVLIICEDRSQRRIAEKAMLQTESLAALGRLSASIAHELNNPLESVTNLLFLISHAASLDEVHHYSQLAEQELARVTRIATQTLRFYRPQAAAGPVLLTDVIESVLTLFEGRLRRERVRVTKHYKPGILPLVTYSGELRQVFVNLVSNALDAMPESGQLRICIRPALNWSSPRSYGVRVTICDAGSGIPRSMIEKVFEPFVTTKEASGTGLGLWISRDIIRRHGGTLRVRSSVAGPAKGTTMCVFLPIAAAQEGVNAA
jgi:PAS domain S-box-containing protein